MIHTLRISLLARTRGLASARGSAPACALRPKPKPRPIYILFWRRPYAPAARPPAVRVGTPGRPPRRLSLCRVVSCVRVRACVRVRVLLRLLHEDSRHHESHVPQKFSFRGQGAVVWRRRRRQELRRPPPQQALPLRLGHRLHAHGRPALQVCATLAKHFEWVREPLGWPESHTHYVECNLRWIMLIAKIINEQKIIINFEQILRQKYAAMIFSNNDWCFEVAKFQIKVINFSKYYLQTLLSLDFNFCAVISSVSKPLFINILAEDLRFSSK